MVAGLVWFGLAMGMGMGMFWRFGALIPGLGVSGLDFDFDFDFDVNMRFGERVWAWWEMYGGAGMAGMLVGWYGDRDSEVLLTVR